MTPINGLPHSNTYLMQEVVGQNRISQTDASERTGNRTQFQQSTLPSEQPARINSYVLRQDSSKSALAAAVKERAQLDYDQPADSEQRAVGQYKAIATYSQRDQLQQMVGIDVYA